MVLGREDPLIWLFRLVQKMYDSVESNEILVGLFMDFSKVFDTISHTILLRKLYLYGIRGIANVYFRDYLTNRRQCVKLNNTLYNFGKISLGVPQG